MHTPTAPNTRIRRRQGEHDAALENAPGSLDRVRFSVVEIREFERVVGDNPSCSSGVPVSIGWGHSNSFTMNLEDFEAARPPRREQMDLVLSRGERHRLLVEWGASGQDVIEAIRMIIRVKNQRRQTVNNLGSYDRIEWAFEKLKRGLMSAVNPGRQTARQLQDQSERAAAAKKGILKIKRAPNQTMALTSSETVKEDSSGNASKKSAIANRLTVELGTVNEETKNQNLLFRESKINCRGEESALSEDTVEGNPVFTPEFGPAESPLVGKKNRLQFNIGVLHEIWSSEQSIGRQSDTSLNETCDEVDDMSTPRPHDHGEGSRITSQPQWSSEC